MPIPSIEAIDDVKTAKFLSAIYNQYATRCQNDLDWVAAYDIFHDMHGLPTESILVELRQKMRKLEDVDRKERHAKQKARFGKDVATDKHGPSDVATPSLGGTAVKINQGSHQGYTAQRVADKATAVSYGTSHNESAMGTSSGMQQSVTSGHVISQTPSVKKKAPRHKQSVVAPPEGQHFVGDWQCKQGHWCVKFQDHCRKEGCNSKRVDATKVQKQDGTDCGFRQEGKNPGDWFCGGDDDDGRDCFAWNGADHDRCRTCESSRTMKAEYQMPGEDGKPVTYTDAPQRGSSPGRMNWAAWGRKKYGWKKFNINNRYKGPREMPSDAEDDMNDYDEDEDDDDHEMMG